MRPSSYGEFAYTVHGVADAYQLERKVVKGLKAGVATEVAFRHWRLAWQLGCLRPIEKLWVGRASIRKEKKPIFVDEYLPCRECEACLVRRSRMWAGRAVDEFERAACTWMGTFTMSPDQHAMLDLRVAERTGNRALTAVELLRERTCVFGQEVTIWLKRVRDGVYRRTGQSGTMRYLLVAEVHDSEKTDEWMRGRPHFHMLLHEASVGAVVSVDEYFFKREEVRGDIVENIYAADSAMIRQAWTLGFTKFQLCRDSKSAYYLCKYMSKAMMWRVRPSIRYGREPAILPQSGTESDDERTGAAIDPPK